MIVYTGPPPQPSETVAVGRGRRNEAGVVLAKQRGLRSAKFILTKGGLRPPVGVAAAGGDPASIAQMYILRACRGIPLSPYAACGRKIGGGAAGRSVSNEKINL